MRLERLDIGGFGRLRDVEIDFHPRMTVLLGENESGKSTVHRALRAALYGLDVGGPGRPTERSDWTRWTPWSGGEYSLVLTYELAGGRRLRVARRLEQRDHTCQVHEIGGGDVTSEARIGRAVAPGHVHLGIDEAVFCASACVGEDGLRLGAADAPAARAGEVQEAIERLADSGDETTAAQALSAIADAITRVGSERRSASPLGRAVNRLRQLDVQVDDARRHLRSLAAQEERLRSLEADARRAEERRNDAERRWLLGRLAAIAAQRADLEATDAEFARVAAEIEGTAHLASFPLEKEDRVAAMAAQSLETRRAADEATARADAAAPQLAEVRRRRAEIGAGLRALGRSIDLEADVVAEATALEQQLAETLAGRRRSDELAAAAGRREALRREIAATGIAGTSAAGVEAAIELVDTARGGRSSRAAKLVATIALLAGAVTAAVAAASHHPATALIAGGVAVVATLVVLAIDRLVAGDAEHARRRLARLCPGVAVDSEGLERLAERLPTLRSLHTELQREDVRIETLAGEVESADARLRELAEMAAALAVRGELPVARPRGASRGAEETVRAVLDAVAGAAGIERRRDELSTEDAILEQREADLDRLTVEATERARAAATALAGLRRVLDAAKLDPALPIAEAVAAFRAGCEGRRRHDQAQRRLAELRRRSSLGADVTSLNRLARDLEARLLARGGDPADIAQSEPLDHSRLQDLETEAEHARQGAVSGSTAAAALRAALAEMRGSAPALADLEDERAACLAARDRGLRQLAALRAAAELIEDATKSIHRDLAPRLAASVAERLAMLTEGRYSAVNIDTAHFEVSLLSRDRPDLVPLDLLSHGTRDQVSLLLRLALAEVLSDAGEEVPLLLDEPLLSADPQRRATALRFLWKLSATNQVVLSTSDPTLVDALEAVSDGEVATVLTMPAAMPTLETTGRAVKRVRVL
ncbi:MAG: AAA family ATPase [Candidatus Dormibacteraeota bacterium]|nr:AAA family ATPase [Candidatus Dormibacteraeota bacterium]